MAQPGPVRSLGLNGGPVALHLPAAGLPGNVVGDLMNLSDQPILGHIATQLHVRPTCPGLQACMRQLGRPFLVKDGFFKDCNIFLLGSNLFHDLKKGLEFVRPDCVPQNSTAGTLGGGPLGSCKLGSRAPE